MPTSAPPNTQANTIMLIVRELTQFAPEIADVVFAECFFRLGGYENAVLSVDADFATSPFRRPLN